MFIAVVDWTPDNRIAKYQDFEAEAEALEHVEGVKEKYPKAFVSPDPGGGYASWLIDARTLVLSSSPLPEPLPVKLPPTDDAVLKRALMDKAMVTQAELDEARAKLGG